jgi:predicted nucleic acid-binding protein
MRLVVADTSPIFYLFSIDLIDLLPQLFGKIFVPDAVHQELCHRAAPNAVRKWAENPPIWMEISKVSANTDAALQSLDEGERAAISLAEMLHADLILIDERKGTSVAINKGFEVTGTLGVLDLAARRGLIDLADSFARLKATNFRYPPEIMDALLKQRR